MIIHLYSFANQADRSEDSVTLTGSGGLGKMPSPLDGVCCSLGGRTQLHAPALYVYFQQLFGKFLGRRQKVTSLSLVL